MDIDDVIDRAIIWSKAILIEPQLVSHMKRYTYAHIKQKDIAADIADQISSNHIRITGFRRNIVFPWSDNFKERCTTETGLYMLNYEALDADVDLHAVDLYKVMLPFGRQAFGLIGESAYYNGPIIEDAIRMYFTPAQKPLNA